MTEAVYRSWGLAGDTCQRGVRLARADDPLPIEASGGLSYLPFGNGRSYGDSCLNRSGVLLDCRGLNRLLAFDEETGVVRCEAGMLLSDLVTRIVPCGWFLPVTPGTQFVTLGGAVANDVHGKNHHKAGTIGRHVLGLELLRSDGGRLICSRDVNAEWFTATIGGMGLTGVISWIELQLKPIESAAIAQEVIGFDNLAEFFALSQESAARFEYTVAWVDSLASGASLGRGLFMRGNHARAGDAPQAASNRPGRTLGVPVELPFGLLNRASLKAFNTLYYYKGLAGSRQSLTHYRPFFYPLDGIANWNRLYGPRGLVQHQSVIPNETGQAAVRELLERSQHAGAGSFLTVLKEFGHQASPGLMSFPRPGVTLTLDFPNRGERTRRLLDELDRVVLGAGGAVNPYKDGRMSAATFQASFPRWRQFRAYTDPRFSSDFWQRVSEISD